MANAKEYEYYKNLYSRLLSLDDASSSSSTTIVSKETLKTIAFSVAAVKFGVRPGYFIEYASIEDEQIEKILFQFLKKFDESLFVRKVGKKLGIIVTKENVDYEIRSDFFGNLGEILGFNYHIKDLVGYLETRSIKENGTLSYTFVDEADDVKEINFYTEVLVLEDYLQNEGLKKAPFEVQFQRFSSFGALLGGEIIQTITIEESEETVMRDYYSNPQKFSKLQENEDKVANYFYNLTIEEIGDVIADKIKYSKSPSEFYNSEEYVLGLALYKMEPAINKIIYSEGSAGETKMKSVSEKFLKAIRSQKRIPLEEALDVIEREIKKK